jgi:predicted nucleic acid-binding protein
VILVDTSAWVDFLRAAPTPAAVELRGLARTSPQELATCEPIAMELLAGCSPEQLPVVERLLGGLVSLGVQPALHFRQAASIYRAVRTTGHTVRSLNDCLIAAVALHHDVQLLHKDADYERIAAVTGLRA